MSEQLGYCPVCNTKLALMQTTKVVYVNNQKTFLDSAGCALPADEMGNPQGAPALEWVVQCFQCGRTIADHPYQKKIADAAAAAKKPVPTPAFAGAKYSEANAFNVLDRRVAALEEAQKILFSRIQTLIDSPKMPSDEAPRAKRKAGSL